MDIRIWAMMRSGHHAIMYWLQAQLEDAGYSVDVYNDPAESYLALRKFKESKADVLIYNMEDYKIEDGLEALRNNKNGFIPRTDEPEEVIILRDERNLFASRLAYKGKLKISSIKESCECYKEHVVKSLDPDFRYIDFDCWFRADVYRKRIAKKFGVPLTDRNLNLVTRAGRGSSFNGVRFDGKGSEMDVLNRWKLYQNNPDWLEAMRYIYGSIYSTKER